MSEPNGKKPSKYHATLDGTTPACKLTKGTLVVTWDPMRVNCDRCEDVILKPASWVTLARLGTPEATNCLTQLASALEQAGQPSVHDQLCRAAEDLEQQLQVAVEDANLVGERLGLV
jgi:hypothetical protein